MSIRDHTPPGTWVVERGVCDEYWWCVVYTDGEHGCVACCLPREVAQLIAAAPEMFAACDAIACAVRDSSDPSDVLERLADGPLKQMSTAANMALGETP